MFFIFPWTVLLIFSFLSYQSLVSLLRFHRQILLLSLPQSPIQFLTVGWSVHSYCRATTHALSDLFCCCLKSTKFPDLWISNRAMMVVLLTSRKRILIKTIRFPGWSLTDSDTPNSSQSLT